MVQRVQSGSEFTSEDKNSEKVEKTQEMGINIKVSKMQTTLVKCRSARVCPERLKTL